MRFDENNSVLVTLPEGVEIEARADVIKVKGEKGELSRVFKAPLVEISKEPVGVRFRVKKVTQREKKLVGTLVAHLKNMIKGVTQGITYKLKICSTHFPMNVQLKGNEFVVNNYLGEKFPRILKLKHPEVKIEIAGDIITVSGVDKEKVAQTAADIELLLRRTDYDKRIFQDGIYIIEKDGKPVK